MANRELTEIKVGDKVEFKYDIEGHGIVKEILVERHMFGTTRTFLVGQPGNSQERWHIMARSNMKHGAIVYLESYDIYAVNGEWV